MSLPADLLTVAQADIESLVADKAQEGPHLEFKRELPSNWNDSAKHELLADVTALANAGGGDIVYGVNEDQAAVAAAVVPLVYASIDAEVRRIQDFLLNLSEPRMPGVRVHPVPVTIDGVAGHVIVIRVPQSWAGPHRTKTNQHFFIRDGLRKRQLDMPEIRGLFLRSDSQAKQIQDFRTARLGRLLAGESPQRLVDGPMLVAHIAPLQAILGLVQVDPVPYVGKAMLPILGEGIGFARVNIDGALAVRNVGGNGAEGYSQFFRNGFFESVHVLTNKHATGRILLPGTKYEEDLIALLNTLRTELDRLGVDTECVVMLSLLRANEVQLGTGSRYGFMDANQTLFDRQTIVLPDVVVRADVPVELGLKPVFDLMWQAAGFTGSANYDANGNWAPK